MIESRLQCLSLRQLVIFIFSSKGGQVHVAKVGMTDEEFTNLIYLLLLSRNPGVVVVAACPCNCAGEVSCLCRRFQDLAQVTIRERCNSATSGKQRIGAEPSCVAGTVVSNGAANEAFNRLVAPNTVQTVSLHVLRCKGNMSCLSLQRFGLHPIGCLSAGHETCSC